MLETVLGAISAFIFTIAYIPYLTDTYKGDTQPQRITWFVLLLLNIVSVANQTASGATDSLYFFYATTIVAAAVFALSIKNGVGGGSKLDIFAIITAFLGIGLWIALDSPLASVVANVFVYLVSATPTFVKIRKDPDSETRITWLLGAVSTAFAFAAVGSLELELILLPIAGVIVQSAASYLLYVRPPGLVASRS